MECWTVIGAELSHSKLDKNEGVLIQSRPFVYVEIGVQILDDTIFVYSALKKEEIKYKK